MVYFVHPHTKHDNMRREILRQLMWGRFENERVLIVSKMKTIGERERDDYVYMVRKDDKTIMR